MRDKTNKTKKGQTLMNTMKKDKKLMKLIKEDTKKYGDKFIIKQAYGLNLDDHTLENFKKIVDVFVPIADRNGEMFYDTIKNGHLTTNPFIKMLHLENFTKRDDQPILTYLFLLLTYCTEKNTTERSEAIDYLYNAISEETIKDMDFAKQVIARNELSEIRQNYNRKKLN